MEWQLISDNTGEGKMSSGGAYALEDVQDIMKRNSSSSFYDGKNDVTCGKTGEEAAIETTFSREMRQNHARKRVGGEGGRRKGGRKKKRGETKASRIYEGFAFPLKKITSRNRGYDIQPRGSESVSFISLSRY